MPDRNGQLNLNKANASQLQRIEGIDQERARQILEYRKEHGPFRDWNELAGVPGLGKTLLEKIRATATLGNEPAMNDGPKEVESAYAEELGEGEEEEIDEEVDALAALARLDLEAAEAYDIAAQAIDDATIVETLQEFRSDHARHFERLNEIIAQRGFEPVEAVVDPERSVFLSLVETSGALGPLAALLSMISSEQLTNSTYESALVLGFDDDVLVVLEQNYDDEKRHLRTLQEFRQREVFKAEQARMSEARPPQPQA